MQKRSNVGSMVGDKDGLGMRMDWGCRMDL